MKWTITILILLTCQFSFAANSIERFLLVAGANDGGQDRATLRYANQDAQSFSRVLTEMGGVPKEHVISLRNPSINELKSGFARLSAQLQNAPIDSKKEVLVYYSGHADENGLLLSGKSFSWQDFRKMVDLLPAQVKISVLDACASGTITRLKGGQRQPAFLMDVSTDMKGYAFITSSSENEVAQESDRIGGSYFTQSLVTGLRGAADLNHDKKVTLGEAYQFAFNETMQRTQSTSGGTQHPARDMKLSGTGDVIMTDLRDVSAGLVLAKELDGRIYIRDSQNHLVAELQKVGGRAMELGIPPGKYSVQLQNQKSYRLDALVLKSQERKELTHQQFKQVQGEATTNRGGRSSTMDSLRNAYVQSGPHWDIGFNSIQTVPWNGSQAGLLVAGNSQELLGDQYSTVANFAIGQMDGTQITSGFNYANQLQGAQISAGINIADSIYGFQLAAGFNIAKHVDGFQISPFNMAPSLQGHQIGTMNIAGDISGLQLGVMNISKSSKNMTIGIFNIVGHSDAPVLGLLNIVGNGYYNLAFQYNELGLGIANFQIGSSYMHSNFFVGQDKERKVHTFGSGFGTQFGMKGPWWIGLNFDWSILFRDWKDYQNHLKDEKPFEGDWKENYLGQVRLESGIRVWKYLGVFAGISGNFLLAKDWQHVLLTPYKDYQGDLHHGEVYAWPGLYAGIKFGRL